MKKQLLITLALITLSFSQVVMAQTAKIKKTDPNRFDEQAAYEQAKAKGVEPIDQKHYVEYLRNVFNSKQNRLPHNHDNGIKSARIILAPNSTQSIGCGNMGFENYDFTNWSGTTGTLTQNSPIVTYNATASNIVNPSGNNVFMNNTSNYHTILTIPPTNPVYPNCNPGGYDSIAVRTVGSQMISEIPFVSPFSFDGASARIGGTSPGQAGELKYTVTKSSTVQQISFSYALVLQNGGTSHSLQTGPIFSVKVINEGTGAILPGCTSYTFNPYSNNPADSLKQSAVSSDIYYRKWNNYSVDLSSLPNGTNVSVVFLVTGCSLGGHFGYAYVDAQCGSIGTPYANMCSGSTFATLVAPVGYSSYQWVGPSGTIAGATNDTLIQNPATPGDTYTVNMSSQGGCIVTQTVVVGLTTVNIINLNSTSSCAGGASGTAYVQAMGSNGIYTYTWTAVPSGAVVSNSQTATGLAVGNYSVLVSSTTCGQASANLSIGVAPPIFSSQSKPFCGNSTAIPLAGGSNYLWYYNSALIAAPIGTNDTLYINNAMAGDVYTVVYDNAQGCRDSIEYTLSQIAGGSSYFSNTANVCPSASNGSTVLNLNTPFSPPYNYFVTGPTVGTTVTNTTTSASSITLSPLAPGTYTAVVNDGTCIYNNIVTIDVIQTNFTVTATNSVQCFPNPVTLDLNFGAAPPTSCGLDPVLCSGGSPTTLFSAGTFTQNGSTDYPTPFGNWYTFGRTQFLVRKAELNAAGITAGRISSLAFNLLALNTSTLNYPNYSIKMGCTALSALPHADFSTTQPFVSGLQTVYSNANQPVSLGWLTHNFTQSYLWDGNSNIIIEVCFAQNMPSDYSQNVSVELKQMPYIANMYHVEDVTPVCGGTQLADNANGGVMTNGENMLPNMKFGYCPYAQPASAYTVSVSPNGTITSTFNNDSIRVAPSSVTPPASGSIIYTVSVTNPIGGCIATRTVEVSYPPITTSITTIPTNTVLCEGGTASLSASGAYSYNWSYQQGAGGPLQPIATGPSIAVTPPDVGINTYVVTGNSPCPSSIPDTKTITVNVMPKAHLIITPLQDVTKCLNVPFVFNTAAGSITPGNTGTPYTYSWTTLPGSTPAPGVNSTPSYTTNSNTTTTLVVTVNGVCAIPTSDTVVVKNYVNNLSIAITNSFITCPNKSLNLNSITTGGHATYNYTWTVNSVAVGNTAALSYTSPSSGGTYNVGLTVIDSCAYQASDNDVIVVLPNTLNIAIVDSISLCGNTPFTLSSMSSGGYPSYSYQWFQFPNNTSLSTSSGLSYTTPEAEGTYTMEVTITDSCGYQRSDFQVINVLPPCKVEIPNVITPNGDLVNDYFKIKNIDYHPNTSVTIFDRWGLKVFESTNYNNEWKGDGVNDGTYFYVIEVPDDKKYSGFITVFRGK